MPCNDCNDSIDCPVEIKHKKSNHSSSSTSKHVNKHVTKQSSCDIPCCSPEKPLDCCTIPYQRLEKLRNGWSSIASTGNYTQNNMGIDITVNGSDVTTVWNRLNIVCSRDGGQVPVPVAGTISVSGTPVDVESLWTQGSGPAIVNAINLVDVSVASTPVTLSHADEGDSNLSNFMYAYNFVNSHRYLPFEECGKQDQVVGWYVNLQTGQLQLFQDLCELNLVQGNTRGQYIGAVSSSITSTDRTKFKALNKFYKLSKRAVEQVGVNLKEEGNIVEVTDKCGQRWLVAVNNLDYCSSVCEYNCEYVLVAIRLC